MLVYISILSVCVYIKKKNSITHIRPSLIPNGFDFAGIAVNNTQVFS